MYEVVVIVWKRRIFMQEKVIVAVDAMGGDNAPAEIVKGVVDAVSQSENVIVKLVGQEKSLRNIHTERALLRLSMPRK